MNIPSLAVVSSLMFITQSACAPVATTATIGATAVVSSTAAPLPLLESITDVRFQPTFTSSAWTNCTSLKTQLSPSRSGQPALKLPNQLGASQDLICKKLTIKESLYTYDPSALQSHSVLLDAQRATEIIDFFNTRQFRWQKGLPPVPYTPPAFQQPRESNELRFYKDTKVVLKVMIQGATLVSSLNGQPVHRELSVEERKWLNERVQLSPPNDSRSNQRTINFDHPGRIL